MAFALIPLGALSLLGLLLYAFRRLSPSFSIPFAYQYRLYVSPLGYYFNLSGETEISHSKTFPIEFQDYKIVPVAIRADNYAYLIIDNSTRLAVAIDPSDPKLVLKALAAEGATLSAVLTTHKHWDHSGGNFRLLKEFPALKIYGSAIDPVPSANQKVYDGDDIKVGSLVFHAIESRVHTKGHLLFLLNQHNASHPPALFSGDALFVAGAGKFFESEASDFVLLVERLRKLDQRALVFPGHEITLSNLRFADFIDPQNPAVQGKLEWTKSKRAASEQTIPSVLAEEFTYNPFLRSESKAIRDNLPPPASPPTDVEQERAHYMAEVRIAKNAFK